MPDLQLPVVNQKIERRDHFLPQGYLRGFIDPARAKSPRPLWCFDIQRKKWSERSTKSVAYRTGLYDYAAGTGVNLESPENSFLRLENDFPTIRAQTVSSSFAQWKNHLDFFLTYMQMIRARSLLYLKEQEEAGKALQTFVIDKVHDDGKTLTLRSMIPEPPPPAFIKNRTITEMRETIKTGADWLRSFNWALRITDSVKRPFVTTEAAFMMFGPCANREEAIQNPETLLFFPLCWQACLIGSHQVFDIETDKFGPEDMKRCRLMYRDSAEIFLLSPAKLVDL
jgi:hypothetical protein